VGPRAGLDTEVRGKILCLYRGSNPDRPARSQTLDIGLMMEAARTSETSVDNYFTRQYIPEDKSEQHMPSIYTRLKSPGLEHRDKRNYKNFPSEM
jgi:hypothetical protein